jgi:hypothetical protein
MKKYLILVLIILEYPLFMITRKIEPTNLAGPGLDIIAFVVAIVYDIFVIRTIERDGRKSIFSKLYLIALIISTFLIFTAH